MYEVRNGSFKFGVVDSFGGEQSLFGREEEVGEEATAAAQDAGRGSHLDVVRLDFDRF